MQAKLIKLLSDYGYKVVVDGHAALVIHDNGYGSRATRYRSVLDAAERLAPIINTDEYFTRLHRIVPN
jgi:hypothetical protein